MSLSEHSESSLNGALIYGLFFKLELALLHVEKLQSLMFSSSWVFLSSLVAFIGDSEAIKKLLV